MKTSTSSVTAIQNFLGKRKFFGTDGMTLFLMTFPCVILIFLFSYVPLYGWIYSFFDYKPGIPLSKTAFVGFKYINLALSDTELRNVMINTLALSVLAILTLPTSAIFAIMLNEIKAVRYTKLIQITTTLPNFLSWIIVFSISFLFFSADDGVLNNLLLKFHFIDHPLNILANADATWYFQTGIKVWKEMGYGAIIYLATIAGIDPELYDAADVDGAGRGSKIMHITIPHMIPTFITLLLLSIGYILTNGLDQYFVFYNPVISNKIEVLDYYVYWMGIVNNHYAYSTALGMFKSVISIIILFGANRLSKKLMGQSII